MTGEPRSVCSDGGVHSWEGTSRPRIALVRSLRPERLVEIADTEGCQSRNRSRRAPGANGRSPPQRSQRARDPIGRSKGVPGLRLLRAEQVLEVAGRLVKVDDERKLNCPTTLQGAHRSGTTTSLVQRASSTPWAAVSHDLAPIAVAAGLAGEEVKERVGLGRIGTRDSRASTHCLQCELARALGITHRGLLRFGRWL